MTNLTLILTVLTVLCVSLFLRNILIGIQARLELLQQEKLFLERQTVQAALMIHNMEVENIKMESHAKLIANGLNAQRAIASRVSDPAWMKDFEKGRDSAEWN